MAHRLPAVYQEDEFLQRFVSAFDAAFAPLFLTLDTLSCYVDPELAPPDFLDWLAEWVGIEVDDTWSVERRREIVGSAAAIHRLRGTAAGIVDAVRLVVGGRVEIEENGASSWSAEPGAALPGSAEQFLRVVVRVPDPGAVDRTRLDRVVTAVKPAHVAHTIDVVEDSDADMS
ncbi:phage tail protein I [Georgenia satyanarayanai]|uniref:phage tail protein I n=1 Tax=Georgenia satyanarayanai TaxID=860221 RepID=UPI002160BE66|nr:phage tail protein I [Georgenia satyanarayanai]